MSRGATVIIIGCSMVRCCTAFAPLSQRMLIQIHHEDSSTSLHRSRPRKRRRRRRHGRTRHDHSEEGDEGFSEECYFLDRGNIDHVGLAKSIDKEYELEEEKLDLSFWNVFERERNRQPEQFRNEASREMTPWARAKRRMNYRKGNLESKYGLMADRNYGDPDLLNRDHLNKPPSLNDLNQKAPPLSQTYWSFPLFRIGVVAACYLAFPLFLVVFKNFQTIDPQDFDIVVNQLAPNVGVLYATILALTLQVLYSRFTRIQENVSTEAMLISQVTRNLLSLFANDREWAVDSCQVISNQVRIMLSRSRGVELLSIMKADTYLNLMAIIDDYHYLHGCDDDFSAREESIIGMLRGEIGQLMETRALRLSDEASSLPPTHFLLLTSLSVTSTVAFVVASLKVVDDLWHPPQEVSLLFAGLLALYVLFFNFCRDLNGPFAGVYQVQRSNAVSHLMQTKWLIVNQLGDDVSFVMDYGDQTGGKVIEDIASVEEEAMQILVNELESTKVAIKEEEDLGEVADAVLTPEGLVRAHVAGRGAHDVGAVVALHSDEEGRAQALSKLHQLDDELSRLKQINEDPEARLHRLKSELDNLKALNKQIANGTHALPIRVTRAESPAPSAMERELDALKTAQLHLQEVTNKHEQFRTKFSSKDDGNLVQAEKVFLEEKATLEG